MDKAKQDKRKILSDDEEEFKLHLVFFGPPGAYNYKITVLGSGKGTQAQYFCKKYNLIHISPGNYIFIF